MNIEFVIGQECRACLHRKVCVAQNQIDQQYQQIKNKLNNSQRNIYGPFKLVLTCPEYINRYDFYNKKG